MNQGIPEVGRGGTAENSKGQELIERAEAENSHTRRARELFGQLTSMGGLKIRCDENGRRRPPTAFNLLSTLDGQR